MGMSEMGWVEEHWVALSGIVAVATAWGHNMTRIGTLEKKLDREINDRTAAMEAIGEKLEKNSERAQQVSERVSSVNTKCDMILEEIRRR